MGGSRRKYKQSRTSKVRVGLPKKNPNVFKPAFTVPPKLRSIVDASTKWNSKAGVLRNYKAFGFVSNPNLLGARARTSHIIESESLQVLPSNKATPTPMDEFDDSIDVASSDHEEDDFKSLLGKKRKDGKQAPLQPLTAIQRVHIGRLIEKHGDNYQNMFMDTKLNAMQHSIATLEKLCKRYYINPDKHPLILSS